MMMACHDLFIDRAEKKCQYIYISLHLHVEMDTMYKTNPFTNLRHLARDSRPRPF